jgi:hypothetical protein
MMPIRGIFPGCAVGDMKPRAFGYQRHPSGIYAGRSSAPSVKQRAGVALHYEAPQETETEMPFLDDVDSPEVLQEWQIPTTIFFIVLGANRR